VDEYTKFLAISIGFVLIKPLEVETGSQDTQLRTDPDNLTVLLTFFSSFTHVFWMFLAWKMLDAVLGLVACSFTGGGDGISCWMQ
jgi:hypothetical protein